MKVIKRFNPAFKRFNPAFIIHDKTYILLTPNMTNVAAKNLKKPVASLAQEHYTITDAIDFLLQGF